MKRISVLERDISFYNVDQEHYISITDIARYKDKERTDHMVQNWLRNRNTIEFLGIWETLNNPHFKPLEFEGFRKIAGLNSFSLTPKKWVETTNAIGIHVKSGRYGGTFAHADIAYEFASWISVEFKLYLIKEFQRFKNEEMKQLGWNFRRNLAKINYRIHTDAIKANLIPEVLTRTQIDRVYACEADLLNMALFAETAGSWRGKNPDKKGNIRDHATMEQLVCLSNLENLNALFINEGSSQKERLEKLNRIAIHQMKLLIDHNEVKLLDDTKRRS